MVFDRKSQILKTEKVKQSLLQLKSSGSREFMANYLNPLSVTYYAVKICLDGKIVDDIKGDQRPK